MRRRPPSIIDVTESKGTFRASPSTNSVIQGILSSPLLLCIRNAVNDDDFIPVCMAKVRIKICETINAKTKNNTKNVRVQTKNRWQSIKCLIKSGTKAPEIRVLKPSKFVDDLISRLREFHWAIVLGKNEYFK